MSNQVVLSNRIVPKWEAVGRGIAPPNPPLHLVSSGPPLTPLGSRLLASLSVLLLEQRQDLRGLLIGNTQKRDIGRN